MKKQIKDSEISILVNAVSLVAKLKNMVTRVEEDNKEIQNLLHINKQSMLHLEMEILKLSIDLKNHFGIEEDKPTDD